MAQLAQLVVTSATDGRVDTPSVAAATCTVSVSGCTASGLRGLVLPLLVVSGGAPLGVNRKMVSSALVSLYNPVNHNT